MAYTTIDDGSVYFQTTLYTGNSSDNAITNGGNSDLQPDLLWVKSRAATDNHLIFDSSRGFNGDNDSLYLEPNNTDAESHDDDNHLKSFNSDGFTMQAGSSRSNNNSVNFVAWQWKINGGTVANDTNGDITTSVQVNQTAGISIAKYTGNGGSGQTLGHGLGAEADIVIFKDRESTSAWRVYTKATGASKFFNLDTADAANTSSNIFPSASSTVIGVEQNDVMNKNNSDFVMYSFRSIQGYSSIGVYGGNGNADGPFVWTGFKPAFILIKSRDHGHAWHMRDDTTGGSGNPNDTALLANDGGAEITTSNTIDFLSNGFKPRSNNEHTNDDGYENMFYMAFAKNPFVSSKGVPVTAV